MATSMTNAMWRFGGEDGMDSERIIEEAEALRDSLRENDGLPAGPTPTERFEAERRQWYSVRISRENITSGEWTRRIDSAIQTGEYERETGNQPPTSSEPEGIPLAVGQPDESGIVSAERLEKSMKKFEKFDTIEIELLGGEKFYGLYSSSVTYNTAPADFKFYFYVDSKTKQKMLDCGLLYAVDIASRPINELTWLHNKATIRCPHSGIRDIKRTGDINTFIKRYQQQTIIDSNRAYLGINED